MASRAPVLIVFVLYISGSGIADSNITNTNNTTNVEGVKDTHLVQNPSTLPANSSGVESNENSTNFSENSEVLCSSGIQTVVKFTKLLNDEISYLAYLQSYLFCLASNIPSLRIVTESIYQCCFNQSEETDNERSPTITSCWDVLNVTDDYYGVRGVHNSTNTLSSCNAESVSEYKDAVSVSELIDFHLDITQNLQTNISECPTVRRTAFCPQTVTLLRHVQNTVTAYRLMQNVTQEYLSTVGNPDEDVALISSVGFEVTGFIPAMVTLSDSENILFDFNGTGFKNKNIIQCIFSVADCYPNKNDEHVITTAEINSDSELSCHVVSPPVSCRLSVALSNDNGETTLTPVYNTTVYAQPPRPPIRFSDTGYQLWITFDRDVKTCYLSSCEDIFEDLDILGQSAKCTWYNLSRLEVRLGKGNNLAKPGDRLKFRDGAVRANNQKYWIPVSGEHPIKPPLSPRHVTSVITGVRDISVCGVVKLSGERSQGGAGRPLLYRWTSQPNLSEHFSDNSSEIEMNGAYLLPGNVYTFSLAVENFLGSTHSTNVTVVRQKHDIPMVAISSNLDKNQKTTTCSKVTLAADVTLSPCSEDSEVLYEWSTIDNSVQLNTEMIDRRQYVIDKYTLPAGRPVTFQVIVRYRDQKEGNSSSLITLNVARQSLKTIIRGGSSRVIGRGNPAVLFDGSLSYDPDRSVGALSYSWNCRTDDRSPCYSVKDSAQGQTFPYGSADDGSKLIVCGKHFDAGKKYLLSLTVSKGDRSSTSGVEIFVKNETLPEVVIEPLPSVDKNDQSDVIPLKAHVTSEVDVRVEWKIQSEFGSAVDISGDNILTISTGENNTYLSLLMLDKADLFRGLTYSVVVVTTDILNRSAEARVSAVFLSETISGCVVEVRNYTALEMITLRTSHCQVHPESPPLSYEYSVQEAGGFTRSLSMITYNPSVRVIGPATSVNHTLVFSVQVCTSEDVCEIFNSVPVFASLATKGQLESVTGGVFDHFSNLERKRDFVAALVSAVTLVQAVPEEQADDLDSDLILRLVNATLASRPSPSAIFVIVDQLDSLDPSELGCPKDNYKVYSKIIEWYTENGVSISSDVYKMIAKRLELIRSGVTETEFVTITQTLIESSVMGAMDIGRTTNLLESSFGNILALHSRLDSNITSPAQHSGKLLEVANLIEPVVIEFSVISLDHNAVACRYWTGTVWSDTGLKTTQTDDHTIQCSSSHLTGFGVFVIQPDFEVLGLAHSIVILSEGEQIHLEFYGTGFKTERSVQCIFSVSDCFLDQTAQLITTAEIKSDSELSCQLVSPPVSCRLSVVLSNDNGETTLTPVYNSTIYAQPPRPAIRFSDTGYQLWITFDRDVKTCYLPSCEDIFDDVKILGQSAKCTWYNLSRLEVRLGKGDNLAKPGDRLKFRDGAVRGNNQRYWIPVSGEHPIKPPLSPRHVTSVITGVRDISVCGAVKLSGERSQGGAGRPLLYRWTSQPSLTEHFIAESAEIEIAGAELQMGQPYTFSLVVQNFLGREHSTDITVVRHYEDIPMVTVVSSLDVTQKTTTCSKVTLMTEVTLCSGDNDVVYEWSTTDPSVQLNTEMTDQPQYIIDKYTLPAGRPVTFVARVSYRKQPDRYSTSEITLYVARQSLKAIIKGGSYRVIGRGNPAVLIDGSMSYDPDRSAGQLVYSWTCKTTGGDACYSVKDSAEGQIFPFGSADDQPQLTVCGKHFQAGKKYLISLTVSKDDRSSTSNTEIFVKDNSQPEVVIGHIPETDRNENNHVINLKAYVTSEVDVDVEWKIQSEFGNSVDLSDDKVGTMSTGKNNTYVSFLQLGKAGLIRGITYSVVVVTTDILNRSAEARVSAVFLTETISGCVVEVRNYTALEMITLRTSQCQVHPESPPLSYEYSVQEAGRFTRSLSMITYNPSVRVIGPATSVHHTLVFSVKVCTSDDTCEIFDSNPVSTVPNQLSTRYSGILDYISILEQKRDFVSALVSAVTLLQAVPEEQTDDLDADFILRLVSAMLTSRPSPSAMSAIIDQLHSLHPSKLGCPKDNHKVYSQIINWYAASGISISEDVYRKIARRLELIRPGLTETKFVTITQALIQSSAVGPMQVGQTTDLLESSLANIRVLHSLLHSNISSSAAQSVVTGNFGAELESQYRDWECGGKSNCHGVTVRLVQYNTTLNPFSVNSQNRLFPVSDIVDIQLRNPESGDLLEVQNLSETVALKFPLRSGSHFAVTCRYWTGTDWSEAGLTTTLTDKHSVMCTSSHLTAFAVFRNDVSVEAVSRANDSAVLVCGVLGGVLVLIVIICAVTRYSKVRAVKVGSTDTLHSSVRVDPVIVQVKPKP